MSSAAAPARPTARARTATPSLRRRVTAAVLGVVAVLLVLVVVLVDVLLGARLESDLDSELRDRVVQAQQLIAAGATPEELVTSLSGQQIRIKVTTADGKVTGDPGLSPPGTPPPGGRRDRGPDGDRTGGDDTGGDTTDHAGDEHTDDPAVVPAAPVPGGRPPVPPDIGSRTVTLDATDGAEVELVADAADVTQVRNGLRAVLAGSVLLTLLVALGAVSFVVRTALRPLDRMTALAGRITAGERDARLRPDRPHTDLGTAAAAMDGMLDALTDAERRSREEAERTRVFLADAAHELRTPLSGITAVAETLERSGLDADPARRARRLELLLGETRRAGRLVTDMLDLARIDGGTAVAPREVDVAGIARAETERAAVLAPGLTVDGRGEPATVRADPQAVSRILANLLDNARRHTPAGGRIDVVTRADPAAGTVSVSVRNTGTPIADGDRERVFDRLVRLQDARDRDSGGAGLGLAIARGLARAHGGDLTCPPDDDGATFVLTLPVTGPDGGGGLPS
ncbi:periplasmic sensor signal transduction histidine kinase [Pseudonocardia sp. Ae717_Ps2]|uniref:sensor histidine kinase n=1 Tax=Pseudonocardia sp. Ae717_Ps2 TaxID=1885573 RepID=UPI00094AFA58|nr:HAMP domain-containing histidine kinase [Pseudonocardia sp. Ae717_Ps2]OLM29256.1 periplasmic sensor signal transduction histidine kinase [Pseudonocardia sp. Ae717_Ps2]